VCCVTLSIYLCLTLSFLFTRALSVFGVDYTVFDKRKKIYIYLCSTKTIIIAKRTNAGVNFPKKFNSMMMMIRRRRIRRRGRHTHIHYFLLDFYSWTCVYFFFLLLNCYYYYYFETESNNFSLVYFRVAKTT